jgi:transposase-like protein
MENIGGIDEIAGLLKNERKAHRVFAKLRWPDGVRCPYCSREKAYATKGANPDRPQWKCAECRRKFSCTTGTVFEGSHIRLGQWLYAMFMICSSKKGVSSRQIHRQLRVTYKTAWFMMHRIRWAMTQEPLVGKLGGAGRIVEVDETYVGGRRPGKRGRGAYGKAIVVALIDRDAGEARVASAPNVKGKTLKGIIREHVHDTTFISSDNYPAYKGLDKEFAGHGTVDHDVEYVRGVLHTNFAENYFSLLKRGIMGTFHVVGRQHIDRYLNEFSFRWNNRELDDGAQVIRIVRGSEGVRLTYYPGKAESTEKRTSLLR